MEYLKTISNIISLFNVMSKIFSRFFMGNGEKLLKITKFDYFSHLFIHRHKNKNHDTKDCRIYFCMCSSLAS